MNKRSGIIRTIIIVLLILSAAAIVQASEMLDLFGRKEKGSGPEAQEIILELHEQELSAGHKTACVLRTVPEGAAADAEWSSSDESVVSVIDGELIPHREGSAEITALDRRTGLTAAAGVSVKDDSYNETKSVLEKLAVSCTDVRAAEAVLQQNDILSECTSEQAQKTAEAFGSFLDLAENGTKSGVNIDIDIDIDVDIDSLAEYFDMSADGLRIAAQTVMLWEQRDRGGVTLSFTGDCSFGVLNEMDTPDRFPAVYKASGSVTYPFDCVRQVFFSDDLTVINFEGTLMERKASFEVAKNYHIRGEPEYTSILTGSSVEVANIANNHSSDYGSKGFELTEKYLSDSGVDTLYDGSPVIKNINGIETVLLSAGDRIQPLDFTDEIESISEGIKKYKKKNNLVIVNLHWGDEYIVRPTDKQIEAAHRLIDEGADIIVGHHSHIIQGIELYKGKVIAYSLGNFSFCGKTYLREMETFILRASFNVDDDGSTVMREWSVIPCYSTGTGSVKNDFRPVPLFGADAENMIGFLEARCALVGNTEPVPYFHCG